MPIASLKTPDRSSTGHPSIRFLRDGANALFPHAAKSTPARRRDREGVEEGLVSPIPGGTPPRFSARLHRDLGSVEAVWRRLEAQGVSTAFQNFAWARAVCERLLVTMNATLAVVEVADRCTGATMALLPMVRVRLATHSQITWLDLGVSDYAAPILAPNLTLDAQTFEEMWDCALGALPRADLIHVSRIPARISTIANPLAELASCRPMDMEAFAVSLEGDAGTLMQRLAQPSVFRELKRRRRKIAEKGVVLVVSATTPEQIDSLFDALLEQRRERFQAVGRFNLLSRPDVAAFYRAAAHEGLADGPVRLLGLSVGGTWIAAVYGLVHDDAFHMVIPTMLDAEWRPYAPGLLLIAATMERSRGQGLTKFDFTVGHLRFKTDLGGVASPLYEIYQATSLRGHVVMRAVQAAASSKAWLKRRPAVFDVLRSCRQRLRRSKTPAASSRVTKP